MKVRHTRTVIVLAMALVLSGACASSAVPQDTSTNEETSMSSGENSTAMLPFIEWPREARLAAENLATRLQVLVEAVEIVQVTTEEMPAGDLGCPSAPSKSTVEPTGIVLGKEVVLRHGEETYVYHVYGRRVVLCQGTAPESGSEAAKLPDASEVALEAALEDLAARLSLDKDAIEILSVEKRIWNDASLGCPEPGKMYAQVMTPGFVIRLKAEDETYEYHASLTRAVLCEQ